MLARKRFSNLLLSFSLQDFVRLAGRRVDGLYDTLCSIVPKNRAAGSYIPAYALLRVPCDYTRILPHRHASQQAQRCHVTTCKRLGRLNRRTWLTIEKDTPDLSKDWSRQWCEGLTWSGGFVIGKRWPEMKVRTIGYTLMREWGCWNSLNEVNSLKIRKLIYFIDGNHRVSSPNQSTQILTLFFIL